MSDLLHIIKIGMLNHLYKWIFHFTKIHEWPDKYNAIWVSEHADHNHTPKDKTYADDSQWNGMQMKEISRNLLGVVTHTPKGRSPTHHPIFPHAIGCTLPLSEFYMYIQYKSHDDVRLSYMEDATCYYDTFRDVLLLGWAGNNVKADANAMKTEQVKKRLVDTQTNAETWTPSNMRHELTAWWDNMSHKMDVSSELDAECNCPNSHWMSYWFRHICQDGALQQYSAKRHNQIHKTNHKDSWNTPITISPACCE